MRIDGLDLACGKRNPGSAPLRGKRRRRWGGARAVRAASGAATNIRRIRGKPPPVLRKAGGERLRRYRSLCLSAWGAISARVSAHAGIARLHAAVVGVAKRITSSAGVGCQYGQLGRDTLMSLVWLRRQKDDDADGAVEAPRRRLFAAARREAFTGCEKIG